MKLKFRFEYQLVVAAVVMAACCLGQAAPVEAQMGGMMRGGGGQLVSSLLAMKEVQKELGMSDQQIDEIAGPASEINDEMRSEMRAIMMGGGDRAELEELISDLQEEEKELVDKLDKKQQKRLQQLQYQRMGESMFLDKDVQSSLDLNDDQISEIEDAMQASQDKMRQIFMDAQGSGDMSGIREAMASNREELAEDVDSVLTEDQRAEVKELKGKPFEFPQRQRGGARRSDF